MTKDMDMNTIEEFNKMFHKNSKIVKTYEKDGIELEEWDGGCRASFPYMNEFKSRVNNV